MWSVYKILTKLNVPRRNNAESNRITFLNKPLSYELNKKLTRRQTELWQAGLILYLGEGSKRDTKGVDLANCDSEVIKIFLRMLREVYGVDESRLRIYIYCHPDKDPNMLIEYWSKITSIPKTQFTKPYIPTRFQARQSDKMKYGLIHIRYSDQRLLRNMLDDLYILMSKLLGYPSGQRGLTVDRQP